jgi:RNA polymerase sigma factor (sigma-70 family)
MPLATADLLPPGFETHLFRKMNFLKWRAEYLRNRLGSRTTVPASTVAEIKRLLAAAHQVRDQIVQANLRLVIFVAKRFVDKEHTLGELVSDGNLSLLRAVEKFDYTRGFRFSTYATWALRYNLSRALTTQRKQRKRFTPVDDQLHEIVDTRGPITLPNVKAERDRLDGLKKILKRLDPREQAIIAARYGLGRAEEEKSLKHIADEMGICKERVRQLQLRALDKLRVFAAEIDLRLPDEI